MRNTQSIWGKLFLPNGTYRKIFVVTLIVSGLVFGISITDFSQWDQIGFFVTAYVLGVPCVIALGNREGTLGNVLGLASNVGEIIINVYFGAIGMAISGIYFGIMHLVGVVRWNKPKYQTKDHKVAVGKLQGEQVIFTIVFAILGIVFMLFFGSILGFNRDITSIFYWLNIVTFVISILSQYLMIMGKTISWWGWFSSNFVNFVINFMTGNYWFMFRDIIYQLNAISSIYSWKNAENK